MAVSWRRKAFYRANHLYEKAFWLYRPFYFAYKYCCDRNALALLRKMVNRDSVALDIGGNIGFYARFLAQCVGENGQVYSFEPDPANYKHLKRQVQGMAQVVPVQAAVGDMNGAVDLYLAADLNVDHRLYSTDTNRSSIKVDCVSIDRYLPEQTVVNFVKMDIQGYEAHALQGMKDTIRRSPGIRLYTELWPYGLLKAKSSAIDYLEQLRSLGFEVHIFSSMDEVERHAQDEDWYTDLYACRKSS